MSEFKFVQWGKGVPNDYQRLNAMMINDQYLKDKLDPSPRGIIAWKSVAGPITIDPTGGADNITGFVSLGFDVEANRLISFSFNTSQMFSSSVQAEYRFYFYVDGVQSLPCGGGGFAGGADYTSQTPAMCIWPSALSQGSHTVTVALQGSATSNDIRLGYAGTTCSLIIRDEGDFVSPLS